MTQDSSTLTATGTRMTAAAKALIEALDPGQRERMMYDRHAPERTDWAKFPRGPRGLYLYDMTLRQQQLAHELIAVSLSREAFAQVTTIMSLERLVYLSEDGRFHGRDPGRYSVCVFGSPGEPRWGWQFEGHHVSLNFTLTGDRVASPTPIFLGAQPAAVRLNGATIVRPCAAEEDAARALLLALDDQQRRAAVLTDGVPPDFVLANVARIPDAADAGPLHPLMPIRARYDELPADALSALRFDRARPAGIPASAMGADQRARLDALVDVYINRLPRDLAAAGSKRLPAAGHLHFAWAGSDQPGERHYYRLQGATFVVEYDVTQDDADHVHTVWRDAENDFGYDVLAAHLAADHASKG